MKFRQKIEPFCIFVEYIIITILALLLLYLDIIQFADSFIFRNLYWKIISFIKNIVFYPFFIFIGWNYLEALLVLGRYWKHGNPKNLYKCLTFFHFPICNANSGLLYIDSYTKALTDNNKIQQIADKVLNRFINRDIGKTFECYLLTEYYFWAGNKEKYQYYLSELRNYSVEMEARYKQKYKGHLLVIDNISMCFEAYMLNDSITLLENLIENYKDFFKVPKMMDKNTNIRNSYGEINLHIFEALLEWRKGNPQYAYNRLLEVRSDPMYEHNAIRRQCVEKWIDQLKNA